MHSAWGGETEDVQWPVFSWVVLKLIQKKLGFRFGMAIPHDAITRVQQGAEVEYSVRDILNWFGKTRRGVHVVAKIHGALSEANLETEPSFETAFIDELIKLKRAGGPIHDDIVRGGTVDDPIIRVMSVAAAHRPIVSVTKSATVASAITLMLENKYSQLPVMSSSSARQIDGMFSWRSLGEQRASGRQPVKVQDAMEHAVIVNHDDDLVEAVQSILLHDVVVVQAQNNTFQGILTIHDIAEQFQALAEPFLLVGEIEKQIRRLIDGRFTHQELSGVRVGDPRPITTVADLTFGEYIRLIESENNWSKLGLQIDRSRFVRILNEVRDIRNDVMHFDPDGLDDGIRNQLQSAKRLLTCINPEPAPRPA